VIRAIEAGPRAEWPEGNRYLAGQAMTQVMSVRLSQPGIADLLPAPSPGNRVTG
jgi:hypothetical protein